MIEKLHKYLTNILEQYGLEDSKIREIQQTFDYIKNVALKQVHKYNPRVSYSGSYAKKTMMSLSYDLDIVVYFPQTLNQSPKELFDQVKLSLENAGFRVESYGVALQIKYNGIEIDIVPAKSKDNDFIIANAYNIVKNQKMRTSLKEQIENAKDVREMIKIMKIWKSVHSLSIHNLALEQLVVNALQDKNKSDYGKCLEWIFLDIKSNIDAIKFIDPVNPNNHIDVSPQERQRVKETTNKSYEFLQKGDHQQMIPLLKKKI